MRKLMWFTIGFGSAMTWCVYACPQLGLLPLVLLGAAGVMTAVVSFWWKWLRRPAAVLLGLTAGICWFEAYQDTYLMSAMAQNGNKLQTTVTAADFGYDNSYGTTVNGSITLDGKEYNVRVFVNDKLEIEPGDRVEGTFRFRYTGKIGQEEATYQQGQGILLLGHQDDEITLTKSEETMLRHYPALLAKQVKNILSESLPEDAAAFAKALLLGDDSEISYDVNTDFKVGGIRHIIAVSGLHVAILYGMLSVLTFRKRFLTALVALPVLFVFAGVAGFTPSVTRACIMVALMILSQCFNKEYDSPTSLSFACLAMLVWNPLVITSVSFQLSAGCVAGILLFNEKIYNRILSGLGGAKGKSLSSSLKRWLSSSVSITLSAMSLTTPLSAYYFGAVSLVGVLTNLLCLWAVNLVFYGLVLICIIYPVSSGLSALAGWGITWLIRYILTACGILADLPLAAVYTKSVYIVAWLIFVYLLLTIFLIARERKPLLLLSCGVVGLCCAVLLSWAESMAGNSRVTVMDVGQGQSILLQSGGRTFLVDCGGESDTIAADTVAETLLSQGISRLDAVILTHGDADHAGGLANLLTRIDTSAIIYPATIDEPKEALAMDSGIQSISVSEDLELSWETGNMTVFAPTFAHESNENSLCILFAAENCVILITGDRSEFGERILIRDAQLPKVDLLIAGHHGSKHSTGEDLLRAVRPDTVIISAGADNPYGHPAPELLERLESFGCKVYRTDENGTIVFRR